MAIIILIPIDQYPEKPFTIPVEKIPRWKEVVEALKQFREMNPWRGSDEERFTKFTWLHDRLNQIYGLNVKFISLVKKPYRSSEDSVYDPLTNTIVLVGRWSVITFLHEWGHVLDHSSKWHYKLPLHGEHWAVAFSTTLFKHVFPDKYAKLKKTGHMLVRK